MKGILMAGGKGSRLFPNTLAINKHLIPIFDKPMIFYPLSIFMLAGISDILIICNSKDKGAFFGLLGDGSKFGINISYKIQENSNGIAEAFILAKSFIGNESVCLVLGDNILYSDKVEAVLNECKKINEGALVFAKKVVNPERFGVIEYDKKNKAQKIIEKPKNSSSNFAIPGIYFFDNKVIDKVKVVTPSRRGELEITSVINLYLEEGNLSVRPLNDKTLWIDAGTPKSLYEAIIAIENIEKETGKKVACLEEISVGKGYLDKRNLETLLENYPESDYKKYLEKVL